MSDQADDLDDAAFAEALVYGPAAPLSLYRRAYAAVGLPWPGDEQVLARHRVIDEPPEGTTAAPASVRQLSWPTAGASTEDERRELDAEFEAAQAEARRSYGLGTVADREAAAVRQLFRATGRAPSEAELVKVAQIEAAADAAMRQRQRVRLVEERARWSPARWADRRARLGLPTTPMDTAEAFLATVAETLEWELALIRLRGMLGRPS